MDLCHRPHSCDFWELEGENLVGFSSHSDFSSIQDKNDPIVHENRHILQTHFSIFFLLGSLFGSIGVWIVAQELLPQYIERCREGHTLQYPKSLGALETIDTCLETQHKSPLNLQRQQTTHALYSKPEYPLQLPSQQNYNPWSFEALAFLNISQLPGAHFFYDLLPKDPPPKKESLFHEAKTVKYYDLKRTGQDNTPHKNDNTETR